MLQEYRFQLKDGRVVIAATPEGFFQALRRTEQLPPGDLGRYLDLIRSRIAIAEKRDIDVGIPGTRLSIRCFHALASLLRCGWIHARRAARSGNGLSTPEADLPRDTRIGFDCQA